MLQLIKVFDGSFGGATLYENPKYITPNTVSLARALRKPESFLTFPDSIVVVVVVASAFDEG